jgi:MerR family transcriptional regulator, light-induced transcriptional regulator
VTKTIHLSEFATMPLYNIKAVVQMTGISPSTLRAWERRYQVCQPQRTESGYRLYSDRDVATIRWLKTQVDAGMTISHAVAWLDNLTQTAHGLEHVLLPGPEGEPVEVIKPPPQRLQVRDQHSLSQDLLTALLRFDELGAEQTLTEAFALYPLEVVGEQIIAAVLLEIGERWHRGEVSVTNEHYATNYLLQRLAVVLRSIQQPTRGVLIWVACAPSEQHEVGALLLVLYLRRAGYHVRYIGKDVPIDDFSRAVQKERPALVLLSANMLEAVAELAKLAGTLAGLDFHRPLIGYGGRPFREQSELRTAIPGIYMGHTALDAVEHTHELLQPANGAI